MTLKASPAEMEPLQTAVVVLTLLGSINWGLVAFADTDLILMLATEGSTLATVGYGAIAAAGVVLAVEIFTETEVLDVLD